MTKDAPVNSAQTMSRLKVLLVDDNADFLEVAADFLSGHAAMEIVGAARSGQNALEMAARTSPDLVVMDLVMPEMNGLEATRRLKALPSPPRVVIVTLYESQEFSYLVQAAGVDDFITKSQFGELLLPMALKLLSQLQAEHP